MFRPEFINRVDEIVVFHSLTEKHLKAIVELQLKEVEKKLKDSLDVSLEVTEKAKEKLVSEGTDPNYGARPLRRAIQRILEDPMSDAVLRGEFKARQSVRVDVDDDRKLVFEAREKQ